MRESDVGPPPRRPGPTSWDRRARFLTVQGDSTFGTDVTVAGDGKLPDHGEPGVAPDGTKVGPDGVQD